MKIPDRIFISEKTAKIEGFRYKENALEYVRKDALLEWAKEELKGCDSAVAMQRAYNKLIDKINSL